MWISSHRVPSAHSNSGKGEEWFRADVRIDGDRIDAEAPSGMTHGVFCLIDENNFLITSEPIPSMQKLRLGQPVSEVLNDGYAYRPGLQAMINHAGVAKSQAQKASLSTAALDNAVQSATKTVQQPVDAGTYAREIQMLRKEIRSLNIPAARHRALNWFPRKSEG